MTERFDGQRFSNSATAKHGFRAFLKWQWSREPVSWDGVNREVVATAAPLERVEGDGLRATFINHSTVLLQLDGVNFLFDPIWSERSSPVSFAGPKRIHAPGVALEDLPPIDVVLISHDHYDHLDLDTVRRLASDHAPRFVVGLGVDAFLAAKGIENVVALDWWQQTEPARGLRVTCVPAAHFSGRGMFDRNKTLWCGFVIEGGGGPVYFAGDTGLGEHFREIRERFGPPRLAMLPIGAFLPRWFMGPVHLSPEEAVEVLLTLDAEVGMAIHFGTFPLADDGPDDAPERLVEARAAAGLSDSRFVVPRVGEVLDL